MKLKSSSAALSAFLSLGTAAAVYAEEPEVDQANLGEITVTGTREKTLKAETPATVGTVDDKEIENVRPAHPSEIMSRIPGVHIAVTGGEGHTTAIRQPLGTSPLYLYLEDGIPTRSTGFFNHNALYEVNVPQAGGLEVNKGPGTALYGSDAIGGVVNVLTRPSPLEAEAEINVEAGENGWKRLLITGGNSNDTDGFRADFNITHTDGWREATDYDRVGTMLRWDHSLESGATLKTVLTTSNIDQQTAGSSRLLAADFYSDPTINYTPISYREVEALRLSTAYEKETSDTLFSVTPFYRHNRMEYMANWSFGYDPAITATESDSLGMLVKYRMDLEGDSRSRIITGIDFDYTPGERLENNIDAYKTGAIYTSYVLGEVIYDYDVTYEGISPYLHFETSPSDRLRINAGLRYDHAGYDYSDNIAGAATVYAVDFNGSVRNRTYNRPTDTTVNFSQLSPKLGATYVFSDDLNGFASYRRAFRAPSEGQLFRPGSSAVSLDLEAVKVDSYELGLRGKTSQDFDYEISLYHMSKKDDLVTFIDPVDTTIRYTVNAGETQHQGVELGLNKKLAEDLKVAFSYSYAKHTYEDWVSSGVDYTGNEMATAPREIMNTILGWTPSALNGGNVEMEWERLGDYWMDNDNTYKYSGYNLLNLRAKYNFDKKLELYGRVMNVTDRLYATNSSYTAASGFSAEKFEYAPGNPRTVYVGINYSFY
ncbi:MAG: TonB-dependent receptor [Gammaproteobacteria bacterium]|nr:TonB-dependent receptor [Gammaproteobacteria bacterium]